MTLILPQLSFAKSLAPEQEKRRLKELYSMFVLDASSNERFEQFTELATRIFDVPNASIVFVDENKLVFKASQGRITQDTSRETSFAAHALFEEDLLIVQNTLEDPRFIAHPMVEHEPHVRFFAGGVIRGPSGQPLGTFSIMDTKAREFTEQEREILRKLTRILEHEMQSRATVADLKKKIREQLLFDGDTQLPTESLFSTQLSRTIGKNHARPLMIAVIRLERFESIHSAVGKKGAAYVVQLAAARLKQSLKRECLLGQMREDTIALAFMLEAGDSGQEEISRMLDCFNAPFSLGEHALTQHANVGTSRYPEDGSDADSLIKRARTALNSTSPSASSRFRQYHRTLSIEAARRFEIETALKGALDRDELELAFQSKNHLETRSLVGVEALLRWKNEKLGVVSPEEFIPVAEDSGLIIDLGDWALETACRQISVWRQAGYECPEIAVNVSSIQIRQDRFCERVESCLKRHSLDGASLNLEITEGTLIENIEEAIAIMLELRAIGVSFSIDDFGKGFSSLSYLARMPVQVLKIDRSFVEGVTHKQTGVTIVRSIIAMGRALSLDVVAEGVETPEQLLMLRAAGCNQAQGFLISPPLGHSEFAERFLTGSPAAAPR